MRDYDDLERRGAQAYPGAWPWASALGRGRYRRLSTRRTPTPSSPISPSTNSTGLELPYFSVRAADPAGRPPRARSTLPGCADQGLEALREAGARRLSAVVSRDIVTTGLYTGTPTATSSGVTVPAPYTWHEMQSPSPGFDRSGY